MNRQGYGIATIVITNSISFYRILKNKGASNKWKDHYQEFAS